jgi:hypothetical protein
VVEVTAFGESFEITRKIYLREEHRLEFLGKKVKVKQSRNRPGVAQRLRGGLGSQIS